VLLKVIYFNGERCGDKEEKCNLSESEELCILAEESSRRMVDARFKKTLAI